MPFDYHAKGKQIPPSKDIQPDLSQYPEIQPSANAHVIQDAPEGQYQMTEEEYQQQQYMEQYANQQ